MKIRKKISEPVDYERDGVRVTGAVNAVVNSNVNESGSSTSSSRQRVRITSRKGKTTVSVDEDSSDVSA